MQARATPLSTRLPRHAIAALWTLALLSACSCGASSGPKSGADGQAGAQANSGPGSDEAGGNGTAPVVVGPRRYGYEVVARYPHDRRAYTQGLLIHDGKLYESTGQHGESSVRLVELETGKVLKKRDVSSQYFGEGLASVDGLLYLLTWKAGQLLLFERETLRPLSYGYSYHGEGWGLTTNDEGLIMSDGTDVIRFMDPKGMKEIRRVEVRDGGRPVDQINELEWIDGEIWANIWKLDKIARIDPATGVVEGWIDMTGLLGNERVSYPGEEVLNGIAYDEATGNVYMTGKRWPYLYHVNIVPE